MTFEQWLLLTYISTLCKGSVSRWPIRGGGRNSARIDERQGKPLGSEERRRTCGRRQRRKRRATPTRSAHSQPHICHSSSPPPPPYQKTRTSCTVAHMEADLGRPRPSMIAAERGHFDFKREESIIGRRTRDWQVTAPLLDNRGRGGGVP